MPLVNIVNGICRERELIKAVKEICESYADEYAANPSKPTFMGVGIDKLSKKALIGAFYKTNETNKLRGLY